MISRSPTRTRSNLSSVLHVHNGQAHLYFSGLSNRNTAMLDVKQSYCQT
jgi:hypothetical protein